MSVISAVKYFANASNCHRHIEIIHLNNVHKAKSHSRKSEQSFAIGTTILQHPFTCIVAGFTKSGKTVCVKKLLENAKTTISPPPERIIWCYGQWQPMYLEMIKTIPGIELNEGTPSDIDSGEFLDVSTRNLIVLENLMTQSGGDKCIANLFIPREVIIRISL